MRVFAFSNPVFLSEAGAELVPVFFTLKFKIGCTVIREKKSQAVKLPSYLMNCTNPLTVDDKFKTKICKLHLKIKKGDNTSRNGTKQTKEQII